MDKRYLFLLSKKKNNGKRYVIYNRVEGKCRSVKVEWSKDLRSGLHLLNIEMFPNGRSGRGIIMPHATRIFISTSRTMTKAANLSGLIWTVGHIRQEY